MEIKISDDREQHYCVDIGPEYEPMLAKAGILYVLQAWHANRSQRIAMEMIWPLDGPLSYVVNNPDAFKDLEEEEGNPRWAWLVITLAELLQACRAWPDCTLAVSP